MKKMISIIVVLICVLNLSSCGNNTIGKISGPENDCITIENITYILDNNHNFSNADKGKYLGKVTNSKITMKVYSVKGDANQDYIYTLWDWEGAFYKRQK